MFPMRRNMIGLAAALGSMAVLTGAMLPLRSNLSIATTALILVLPVVIGVVTGGFLASAVSVIAGFLVYDFFFIPPYWTLEVGVPQNWVAAGVYVLVMLPVARVVASMNSARAQARRRGLEIKQLFDVSDMLVEDRPLEELLDTIVTTLAGVFGSRKVALLLPRNDRLEIVASAGDPLTEEERGRLLPTPGALASLNSPSAGSDRPLAIALTAAGRPIGLLVLSGGTVAHRDHQPLLVFANQIALAVERAQLREQALRNEVTQEVERMARMLVAAVSHDLRSPLSSIKASSSTLADPDLHLSDDARSRLAALIDTQADRLAVLVKNLLDMSRVQAGVLQPQRAVARLSDLVAGVLADLEHALDGHPAQVRIPDDLPPVDVDAVLISRVLTNLLENAARYAPARTPITVTAAPAGHGAVQLSVTDHGPGVNPGRRNEIFGLYPRRADDTGAGLGLTIAKAFIEAHGQRIWVEDAPGGGARFCCTLPEAPPAQVPAVSSSPEVVAHAADTHH
jgi:two-component system, OmpR family, sensor histidine kinase KdpD